MGTNMDTTITNANMDITITQQKINKYDLKK